MKKVLVTGAGGFIGHHLTKFLVERGYWVRGVDVKLPEYEATAAHEFELLDLRRHLKESATARLAATLRVRGELRATLAMLLDADVC